jgi:hypothetical protein
MILLFAGFAWIVVLSIVVGVCVAAQIGDRAQLAGAGEPEDRHSKIPARRRPRAVEPRASLLDRDGVAA